MHFFSLPSNANQLLNLAYSSQMMLNVTPAPCDFVFKPPPIHKGLRLPEKIRFPSHLLPITTGKFQEPRVHTSRFNHMSCLKPLVSISKKNNSGRGTWKIKCFYKANTSLVQTKPYQGISRAIIPKIGKTTEKVRLWEMPMVGAVGRPLTPFLPGRVSKGCSKILQNFQI